jgi:membrane-bound metal-dependent hydrolase YbcI (DUF457 family)
MTLPEHAICSAMLAEFGMRPRFGWRGTAVMVAAGIAPDLDVVAKLAGDQFFWQLHHALGHGLLPISMIAAAVAGIGRAVFKMPWDGFVFGWCLVAAAGHVLTDALYWWGINVLWPFGRVEICFHVLEYLDLLVLAIWLIGAVMLYRTSGRGRAVAATTLGVFAIYVGLRAVLPPPTGVWHWLTGGWMYAAPQGTPVLDWW